MVYIFVLFKLLCFNVCAGSVTGVYVEAFSCLRSKIAKIHRSQLPLVQDFFGIATHAADKLHILPPVNSLAFMNQHYMKRWVTEEPHPDEETLNSIQNTLRSSADSSERAPIEKFHMELARRFKKNLLEEGNEGKFVLKKFYPCLRYPKSIAPRDKTAMFPSTGVRKPFSGFRKDKTDWSPFVNGHEILLRDFKLPFPLLTVSLYDRDAAYEKVNSVLKGGGGERTTESSKKVNCWFAPLEP